MRLRLCDQQIRTIEHLRVAERLAEELLQPAFTSPQDVLELAEQAPGTPAAESAATCAGRLVEVAQALRAGQRTKIVRLSCQLDNVAVARRDTHRRPSRPGRR